MLMFNSKMRGIPRIISVLLLSVVMVTTSIPMTAQEAKAASVIESDSTFTLTDDGVLTIKSVAFKHGNVSRDNRDLVTSVIFKKNVTTIRPDMLHSSVNPDYRLEYDDWGNGYYSGPGSNFHFLKSITIESGVTTVLQKGFWKLPNLTSITIPATVEDIGDCAFEYCIKLKSVNLPDKVTTISNELFYGCEVLSSVKLGKNVTSIGEYAFSESGLTGITLPASLTSMGTYAFANCESLGSITIPAKCTVVPDNAFKNCVSLTKVTFNEGLTKVGNSTFYGCPITTITFPKTLGSIGEYAFQDTSLKTITFKGTTPVDSINERAFVHVNNAKGYYPYGSNTVLLDSLKNKFTGNQNSYPEYANITWVNSAKTSIASATVTGISNKTYTGKAITQSPVVKVGGKTLKNGTDYTVKYTNNVKVGTATVTITGKGSYTGTVKKTFKITTAMATFRRLSGPDRFGTSSTVGIAYMNDSKQTSGFNYVVVANAFNPADALSAGPLAAKYKAPVLLVDPGHETFVLNWIKKNVKKTGTVFLAGGPIAVRDSFQTAVKKAGYKVSRVAGNDRIGTNLAVLKNVGLKKTDEVLVVEGSYKTVNKIKNGSFHEALIASATGKPVLLVQTGGLSSAQQTFLKNNKVAKFTIIGNTSSVSSNVETQLKKINKNVTRVKGSNYDELSVNVAKKYWKTNVTQAQLATGNNFADALSGCPICIVNKGPIFLVNDQNYTNTSKYLKSMAVKRVTVFGGPLAVSDALVKKCANIK